MPKKHGLSHAFTGMVSTLLGGILIKFTSEQVLGLDITKYFGIQQACLNMKLGVNSKLYTTI